MTDFRALCAELVTVLDSCDPIAAITLDDVITRARAALAQPEGASTYRLLQYIEELSGVLESCAEMIQEWGNYADKYYQEKHCLEADVAYAKSNAARAKRVARQTDNLGEYDD
jgi:hypothetical protein